MGSVLAFQIAKYPSICDYAKPSLSARKWCPSDMVLLTLCSWEESGFLMAPTYFYLGLLSQPALSVVGFHSLTPTTNRFRLGCLADMFNSDPVISGVFVIWGF